MAERDLAAAHGAVARRGERQLGAAHLDLADEQVDQRDRCLADIVHRNAVPGVERRIERRQRDDRRRADAHALDAEAGAVVEVEGEGRFVAHPAGQRRAGRLGMLRRDIDEGRRAGSAIQIFVGAADREIGVGAGDIDRQRAGRMREVPDGQRARRMRLARSAPSCRAGGRCGSRPRSASALRRCRRSQPRPLPARRSLSSWPRPSEPSRPCAM